MTDYHRFVIPGSQSPPLDSFAVFSQHRGMTHDNISDGSPSPESTGSFSEPQRERFSPNENVYRVARGLAHAPRSRIVRHRIASAEVLDFGIATPSSLELGVGLTDVCTGGLARTSIVPCDAATLASPNGVFIQTDDPLLSCIGCQYAGWPVQSDDYFAMGSGPMRLLRGQEAVLLEHELTDSDASKVCGVLESDNLPTASAVETIASDCGRDPSDLLICVAPSTSIAGSVQIVARSVETAMHKLHEIGFDIRQVVSGTGFAPLPPPAKRSRTMTGIGRTNDAMLYGAHVTLWVTCEDADVESIINKVPSSDSSDHGKPFEEIFADNNNDFYAVDPNLFSPAVVTIHNLKSGNSFSAGRILTDVLRASFGT